MNVITLNLQVSDETLKDLLTTCYEGGSAYWLQCIGVVRDSENNVIEISGCADVEEEIEIDSNGKTPWGDATPQTMLNGLVNIANGYVAVSSEIRQDVLHLIASPYTASWDAETADCILQVGLLNEIVYG